MIYINITVHWLQQGKILTDAVNNVKTAKFFFIS